MYIIAIVQARMGSTRLPNKAMQSVSVDIPMIEVLFSRLNQSKEINKIVLATSIDPRNQPLVNHISSLGFEVFQGSENNVLDRYYQAALKYNPDVIVRITGDCPLVDQILWILSLIHTNQAKLTIYAIQIHQLTLMV